MGRDRGLAAGGAFALAGLGAAQLALTWCVKRWVEGPLLKGGGPESRQLLWLSALLVGAIAIFLFLSRQLLALLSQNLMHRVRSRAASSLLVARYPDVRGFPQGDLLARVFHDTAQLSSFAEQLLRRLAGDAPLAGGAIVLMAVVAPRISLLALLVAPVVAALLSRLGSAIRRRSTRAQAAGGAVATTFADQLRGLATIRALGAVASEADRFAAEDSRHARDLVRAERGISILVASVFAAAAAGFVAAVVGGSAAVAAGAVSPGALLAFCLYAGQAVEPLRRLAEVHGMLQKTLAAADRVFKVVDLPREAKGGGSGVAPARAELRIEKLRFRYRGDEPLLEGVDLHVPEGGRLALAAASGAGKSTLARLLGRLETPDSGRILIGGTDLLGLPIEEARRGVLVLEQDTYVFSATLAENLALGAAGVSKARLERAALESGLGPLMAAIEGGLEGRVGDGGRALSGGERQRVAIARALLRDPAVLVLDEATSALDEQAEHVLFEAMRHWLEGRTLLAMAHRLSTLRLVGRVTVLVSGRCRTLTEPFDPVLEPKGAVANLLEGADGSAASANIKRVS